MDLFNELFGSRMGDNIIFTPQKIALEMIEALPAEIWNRHTKFLDPCCKSGIYLQEIRNKLMACDDLIEAYPDEQDRLEHIDTNQLYGLAINENCLLLSTRNVCGRLTADSNIRYIQNYIQKVKDKNTDYKELIKEELGEVKFDVVIGNPPYQDGSRSIYPKFIDLGIQVSSRIVTMIVKNNWLTSDDMQSTRENMLGAGLNRIISYPLNREVFTGVNVNVNIFNVDKLNSNCQKIQFTEIKNGNIVEQHTINARNTPIILKNKAEESIVLKVLNSSDFKCYQENVGTSNPFGVETNFNKATGFGMPLVDKIDDSNNIKIVHMHKGKPAYVYTAKENIEKGTDKIGDYKVICGEKLHKNSTVISNVHAIGSNSICTGSWALLYSSKSRDKTINAYHYIRTKFFRFLVGLMCSDGGMARPTKYRFSLVPTQTLGETWTDDKLYKKYNLTPDEIDYIEKTIKPMK